MVFVYRARNNKFLCEILLAQSNSSNDQYIWHAQTDAVFILSV